jgi:hypothetical protein
MNMGAWGELAFDNDTASDWAYELAEVEDLSLIESTLSALEGLGSEYVDQDIACDVLAACEVLAKLKGNPDSKNAYPETVDAWVAAHPLTPSPALLKRAVVGIDRILGDESELRGLWEDAEADKWLEAMADLRRRLEA